jgi:hypothetical protein
MADMKLGAANEDFSRWSGVSLAMLVGDPLQVLPGQLGTTLQSAPLQSTRTR